MNKTIRQALDALKVDALDRGYSRAAVANLEARAVREERRRQYEAAGGNLKDLDARGLKLVAPRSLFVRRHSLSNKKR